MVVSMSSMSVSGLFMSKIDSRIVIFDSIAIVINSWPSIGSRGMDWGMMNWFVNRDMYRFVNWEVYRFVNYGSMVHFWNMDRGMMNSLVNMMNRLVDGGMVDWGMMNRMNRGVVDGAMVEWDYTMVSLGQGSKCEDDKGLK